MLKASAEGYLITYFGLAGMGNKKKVYLCVPWVFDRLGGVDIVVDQLFFAFRKSGCDVFIVEQSWDDKKLWKDENGRKFIGLNFVPIGIEGNLFSKIRRWGSLIYHSAILFMHLKSNKVDVINAHFPTHNLFVIAAFKALRLWNGKLILSFHGSDVADVDCSQLSWRLILKNADVVTFCSIALRTKFETVSGYIHPFAKVIHNGVDYDKLNLLANSEFPQLRGEVPDSYFLCLANFVPHKGQDLIIKCLSTLKDVNVVFAGGYNNGKWVAELKALAQDLCVADRVYFIFDVPHEMVPSLLKRSDALVLSSHYESFGLVVAESSAVGTPVIATNVGGIPEILPNNDYGILIEPDNVSSLTDAIEWVIKNPQEMICRASLLRKRISDLFSLESMTSSYIELIK